MDLDLVDPDALPSVESVPAAVAVEQRSLPPPEPQPSAIVRDWGSATDLDGSSVGRHPAPGGACDHVQIRMGWLENTHIEIVV